MKRGRRLLVPIILLVLIFVAYRAMIWLGFSFSLSVWTPIFRS
jgi:type VI protein secretion system component VasF